MIWKKLGKIWEAKTKLKWGSMSTLTPAPFILKKGVIRVYCAMRDNKGVARLGYFDVDEKNPKKVIGYSKKPVLHIGVKGSFDDNGMLLGDVIKVKNEIRMYYVGFQIVDKVKFIAYGGVAISKDGKNFSRYSNSPIIDRDDNGLYIRAIHGIKIVSKEKFQAWIAEGSDWEKIKNKPYPRYSIATIFSKDGLNFEKNTSKKIRLGKKDEYRIGRPKIFSLNKNTHFLTFTYGKADGTYESSYAISKDLINWKRKDDFGLKPSKKGFDSIHLAYPALIKNSCGDVFCFYNGNNMGEGGIGAAKLIKYK